MNTILTTPLSVVGTRIQTSRKKVGILTTFSNIIQQDGLLSFWSGLEPSLILSINPAITHLCYEKLKSNFLFFFFFIFLLYYDYFFFINKYKILFFSFF